MQDREYVDILRTLSESELELCSPALRSKALGAQACLGKRVPDLGGWGRTVREGGPGKTPKGKTPGENYGRSSPAPGSKTPLWIEHGGAWISVCAETAVLHQAQGRTIRMMTTHEMQEAGLPNG